jgi:hypothetical protein
MRIGVIGDIGGHLDVFERALVCLGVDVASAGIPPDLTVVQVGDLVHKGPDSGGCVALADRLLASGRYVQLLGNHEAHYLGGPDVRARPGVQEIAPAAAAVLRRWHRQRTARLAVAAETTEYGEVLLTHGGLTFGLWRALGSPSSLSLAADRLNSLLDDPAAAFRPGWLMTGVYDSSAGVTCPRTGVELAAPWLERGEMPFSQVHGHEGVWYWPSDAFHEDCPPAVRAASTVDTVRRLCSVEISGRVLLSVDWVLGEVAPAGEWEPLLLDGAVCGLL